MFHFGDKVTIARDKVTGREGVLFSSLPEDTEFYIQSSFDDPQIGFVSIMARRNGIEKCFWIDREAIELN